MIVFSTNFRFDIADNHQSDGDTKHRIGNVKRRPVMRAHVEIQEIPHFTFVECPVVKIAHDAGGKECKCHDHCLVAEMTEQKNAGDYDKGND